jgi:hypothetical protein
VVVLDARSRRQLTGLLGLCLVAALLAMETYTAGLRGCSTTWDRSFIATIR